VKGFPTKPEALVALLITGRGGDTVMERAALPVPCEFVALTVAA
jgi:hypothetical protein